MLQRTVIQMSCIVTRNSRLDYSYVVNCGGGGRVLSSRKVANNFAYFMEPSSPVPSSQEPVTGHFGGSDESIPHVEDF